MLQVLLINQLEHIKVKIIFSFINLLKLYLDVADVYIKLSSGFNTLATSDKTDLSK
jgi:hypothetical protein